MEIVLLIVGLIAGGAIGFLVARNMRSAGDANEKAQVLANTQLLADAQKQKQLARKQQIAAASDVVDKFKQLKKLDVVARQTYMQQHGTNMPIKIGRKNTCWNHIT